MESKIKELENQISELKERLEMKEREIEMVKLNSVAKSKIKNEVEYFEKYYNESIKPEEYRWSNITIGEHYNEIIDILKDLI